MSSFWWTLLAVFVAVFTQVKCESTAYPVIPNHLLECYMDDGIYHRANRLPHTFESFLDLVRKVEESPTSRNMNARELSLALLHYLKLDGIQSIRSHTKYFPSNILPFAPSGAEYFKHRLTLVGLIPRIDRAYMVAFNETLTMKEMCNLHFMLSYSIDPYKRDDERCSPLFGDFKKGVNTEPRSEWDSYQNIHTYRRRHRRHVDHGKNLNVLGAVGKSLPNADEKEFDETFKQETLERLREASKPLTKRQTKNIIDSNELSSRKRRNSVNDKNKKLEVEEIFVPPNPNAQKKVSEKKDKFTIGDQELLSGVEEHRSGPGMQSLTQVGNFGKFGGRVYPIPSHSIDDTYDAGVIPGIPLSECPVVNGVITTPFSSVTIGTVIAGIAAGLNPEEIPPIKLSVEPSELESPSDRVKNTWAATLAGTVADTISSSALLDIDNLQVLKGGWNDSTSPEWYLLASNQFKHMSEVALRGSLDGLYLGLNAKEWTGRFSGFKLSQMLQIYYDSCWGSVGAKYRVQLRSNYAPDELFRKQVYLMSLVLKKQKTNVLTVLDYSHIAREVVGKVIQHIQMMDDKEKSYIGSFLSTKIDNSVNMIAVVDSSWGHESLFKIFQVLRNAQVASTIGNKLTILCGKDGRVLLSSENSVDVHNLFTKEMLVENCTRGMDLPLVFDTIDAMYRKMYHEEKTSQKMNTTALLTVLFPFEQLLQDSSYIVEKSFNFRNNFPDVRLIIAANGRSESFQPLVKNNKDLFTVLPYVSDPNLKAVKDFAEGIKQSYQRINRPSCGSYFDDDTPGTEIHVTRDVGPGNIVYYRLLPQYFYTQHGQAVVTIKSKLRAPLTVCHSREMDRPVGPTPRGGPEHNFNRSPDYRPDLPPNASPYGRETNGETEGPVQCKTITSETYKIEMNNPCEGASGLQECLPLYISLSPPLQETVSIICPTCRLPTNVQYEISVTGLTCYNSAVATIISPLLFSLFLIHYFLIY